MILEIISMVFSIAGLVMVFKGYKFIKSGSYEGYKWYSYGFLALAGGDFMSAFRRGFADPDIIDLILGVLFIYFAYKEWKSYIGR